MASDQHCHVVLVQVDKAGGLRRDVYFAHSVVRILLMHAQSSEMSDLEASAPPTDHAITNNEPCGQHPKLPIRRRRAGDNRRQSLLPYPPAEVL